MPCDGIGHIHDGAATPSIGEKALPPARRAERPQRSQPPVDDGRLRSLRTREVLLMIPDVDAGEVPHRERIRMIRASERVNRVRSQRWARRVCFDRGLRAGSVRNAVMAAGWSRDSIGVPTISHQEIRSWHQQRTFVPLAHLGPIGSIKYTPVLYPGTSLRYAWRCPEHGRRQRP